MKDLDWTAIGSDVLICIIGGIVGMAAAYATGQIIERISLIIQTKKWNKKIKNAREEA